MFNMLHTSTNKVTTINLVNNFTKKDYTLNFATKQIILENKEKLLQEYHIKIGDTNKTVCEKKGYSQDELAEIMKVNRTKISKIENGKFNFSINYLSKFSCFLDFEFQLKEIKNN